MMVHGHEKEARVREANQSTYIHKIQWANKIFGNITVEAFICCLLISNNSEMKQLFPITPFLWFYRDFL